jgi:hypothetical protein
MRTPTGMRIRETDVARIRESFVRTELMGKACQ